MHKSLAIKLKYGEMTKIYKLRYDKNSPESPDDACLIAPSRWLQHTLRFLTPGVQCVVRVSKYGILCIDTSADEYRRGLNIVLTVLNISGARRLRKRKKRVRKRFAWSLNPLHGHCRGEISLPRKRRNYNSRMHPTAFSSSPIFHYRLLEIDFYLFISCITFCIRIH